MFLSSGGALETLTGNSGGPVGADASHNINIIGSDDITVTGNPGTNTLTIDVSGDVATTFDADLGTAVPLAGVLNIVGGANIHTSGATDTITVSLDNAIDLPITDTLFDQGALLLGGIVFLHSYGTNNVFLGSDAGNGTLVGDSNTGIGFQSLFSLTSGLGNSGLGAFALTSITSGSENIAIGASAGINYVSSESSNIIIGNSGTVTESNVIRIGTQGAGAGQQNTCFIAGITGVTVANQALVTLNTATGQLGTTSMATSGYTNVHTSPYVVLTTDFYLSVDTSTIAITVQLPNAPATGRIFNIKDRTGNAATHNITVTTVGGAINIDAAVTFVMNTAYEAINVIFNGSTYEVF